MKKRWNLVDAREVRGMDQRALSRLIKMSFATTCNIELGVRGPNEDVQNLLEKYFSVPREKLFELFERELPEPIMKNRYEIRGEVTVIFIEKPNGEIIETIIDTLDLESVKSFPYTWCAITDTKSGLCYIRSTTDQRRVKGKMKGGKCIRLHRLILGVTESRIRVDHINHDTLDNRRSSNLRVSTGSENAQNKLGANANSTTGVRNVYFVAGKNKYRVSMGSYGKRINVGYFKNLADAEIAAIEARAKYMPYSQEALSS